jgi:hypothetical protein
MWSCLPTSPRPSLLASPALVLLQAPNSASASPPTATKYGLNPSVKLLNGTAIVLDPAGSVFAAIGAGNLRAWADAEAVGHSGLSN